MKKPVSSSKYKRATPVFEGLEPRILFSADLPGIDFIGDDVDADLDISTDDILDGAEAEFARLDAQSAVDNNRESGDITLLDDQPEPLLQSSDMLQNSRHELVVIDANVADYSSLVDNLQSQAPEGTVIDVLILDADRNGIEQLSEILANRQDLDALHLISHGSSGTIAVGNSQISQAELTLNSAEISNWGSAFSDDGDLLIYGCDLAADLQGELFINTLATLTAADVAASDDLTGNAILGGNWELEYKTGQIDALYTFTDDLQASWQNLLSSDVLLASSFDTSSTAPINTVPSDLKVDEDNLLSITGISINDVDGNLAAAQLSVDSGTLKVDLQEGGVAVEATISSGSNDSKTFTLSGTQTQINDALATLSYQGDDNFNGNDTLTLVSTDSTAVPFSVTDTVDITVTPVNDAPVNNIPTAQSTNEDTVLVFNVANLNTILINDIDAGTDPLEITLTVNDGILTLPDLTGLTLIAGSNGSAAMTYIGPLLDINSALDGLTFTPDTNFTGAASIQISTGEPIITLSTTTDATLGGLTFTGGDLAQYDMASGNAELSFDGELFDGTVAENIDGLHVLDNGHIILSTTNLSTLGSNSMGFDAGDLIEYDPVTKLASLYFDHDLFEVGADINAVHVLDNGHIVLSTDGDAKLGDLTFTDGDLIEYDPVAKSASLYFSNTLFGVSEDINAVHVLDNGHIVLSTASGTTLGGLSFDDGDLVEYDPIANSASLYFNSASLCSLPENIDAAFINTTQTDTDVINITVNAVNTTPTTSGISNVSVDEDAADTVINLFDVFADAEDVDSELTYTITNNTNAGLFTSTVIDAVAGSLSLGYTTDQNGIADITVRATDTGGLWVESLLTITVNPINDAPDAESEANDYVQAINDLSPVGYWQLDQTVGTIVVNDASATNGTYVNGVSLGVAGAISGSTNTAADFDGIDDYISLPHEAAHLIDNGMIQLWFNADNLSGTQTLISKDHQYFGTGGHLYVDLLSTGELEVRLQSTDDEYFITSSGAGISAGGWYHMAFSFGDNGMQLYLNGEKIGSDEYTGGLAGNTNAIVVGASNYDVVIKKYFEGQIDDVAIFATQVNAESIQDLYAGGLQYYTINEDSTLNISAAAGVLANDFDTEGDALTAALVSNVTDGTLTLSADGSFDYTPNADFNGTDSFTYKVNDGTDDSSTVTATITVNAVNDAPLITIPLAQNVNEDISLVLSSDNGNQVLITDIDSDTVTVTLNVENGHLTLAQTTNLSFVAGDGISDATMTFTGAVTDINDALNGLTFKPFENYNGSADLDITVEDMANAQSLTSSHFPVAYYKLDQSSGTTAVDSSGNGLNGTLTNMDPDTDWLPGEINNALDFDGSDDYITVPHNDSLSITDKLTLAAWVNADSDGLSGWNHVICKGTDATTNNYFLAIKDQEISFGFYNGGWQEFTTSGQNLQVDTWYHIAATFDDTSDTVKVYLNGIEVLDATTSASPLANSQALTLGRSETGEYWNGKLDEISIFNSVLEQSELQAIYKAAADGAGGLTSNETVTITVDAINDAPVATEDVAVTTAEDVPIGINVISNDTDVDGTIDPATVVITTAPTNGSVTVNASTGEVTYTPDTNYNGPDSFEYTVKDDDGAVSDPAKVTLTVSDINDKPVAIVDSDTVSEDGSVVIDVTDNDSDADGTIDPTSVVITTQPTNGTVTVDATTGAVTYTPTADYNGPDSFEYTVKDNEGAVSDPAKVTLTVSDINDKPVAIVDSDTVSEDGSVVIDVTTNDTDADGSIDLTTVSITSAPTHGSVTVDGSTGAVTYTPTADYNGPDSFEYTVKDDDGAVSDPAKVTLTVSDINDKPVAVVDSDTVSEDGSVVIDVTDNDSDVDGTIDATTVVITTAPTKGSVSVNGITGAVTYTPNANYHGPDSFEYTVKDDDGLVSDPAKVTLTVSNSDDPAVITGDTSGSGAEDGAAITGDLNATDVDGLTDGSYFTVSSDGTNGAATIDAATGAWRYQANADYNGADSFTVTVTDDQNGTSTQVINVGTTAVVDIANDADSTTEETEVITNVFAGDGSGEFANHGHGAFANGGSSGADSFEGTALVTSVTQSANGGAVTIVDAAAGTISYTPALNFIGSDTYTYTVTSGGVTETATVTIAVSNSDDPAVITDDTSGSGAEDGAAITGDLNATDVDGLTDGTIFSVSGNGSNGTASINEATGAWRYQANADYNGADSFTVTVTDDLSGTSTQVINVSTTAEVDIAADAHSTNEETEVITNVFADNGSGVDSFEGSPLVTAVTQSANGGTVTIVDAAAGTISYTPALNFIGSDTYTYTVTSGGVTETATVTIAVSNSDDAAAITGDITGSGSEDGAAITGDLNATDVDGLTDGTIFSVIGAAANGTAIIDAATGTWSYQVNADYNGADSFTVTVTDDLGGTSTQVINVGTTAVVDIAADAHSTNEETEVITNVFADNGSGADSFEGTASVTSVTQSANGGSVSIVDAAAGTISYTPATNFVGTDTYTYTVTSGGVTETATVTISVGNVDDPATITGDITGNGTEDGLAITGDLDATDVDGLTDGIVFTVSSDGTNGAATIDAETGVWSYQANADYNGTDNFTVTVTDDLGGTTTQTVSVTLANVDDSAVISGVYTGDVVEDVDPNNNTLLETSGSLTITDADVGEASFIAGKTNGIYGDLLINSAGDWRYSADNTQYAIQQLDTLEILTDYLTVTSADGTSQNVIITIKGAADDNGVIDNTPIVNASVSTVQDNSDLLTSTLTPVADIERSTDLNENTAQPETHVEAESTNVDLDLEKSDQSFIDVLGEQTSDYNFSLSDTTVSEEIFLSVLSERSTEIKERDVAKPTVEITPTFFQEITSFWKDDGITAAKGFEADQFEFVKSQSAQNSPEFRYDLNKMIQEIDASAQAQKVNEELSVEAVTGVSMTVAAGFASWMLRGGTLLASFLTAMPTWRSLDVLPILAADEKSKAKQSVSGDKENMDDTERDTEAKVDELFEQ